MHTEANIPQLVESARRAFQSGITRSREWREAQLDGIARFLKDKQEEILLALETDLGKPRFESLSAEIFSVEWEATHAKKRLKQWMMPQKVPTPLLHQPARSWIQKEPLGVVLVMGAWNYPVQLTLAPLVGVVAAGNCAILKPSEVSPATSALLAEHLPAYLDPRCIKVVEGGVPEATELLKQKFDHIMYTGNGSVARVVMRAAAEHLTPVTLELGGKSPCIIDDGIDLDVASSRVAWAKFFNCGQTCVAPDYLLIKESIYPEFVTALRAKIEKFWGPDPSQSPAYGRIVNQRHYRRLMSLLEGGGKVLCGGTGVEEDRCMAPTLLEDVSPQSAVMQDEIFGPILPLLKVTDIPAAMEFVNCRPKPLALYLFTESEQTEKRVLEGTSSGAVVVNHCMLQNLTPELPFGGVGESGIGAYHGRAGFETFSHHKPVLKKPFALDPAFLYPTYSARLSALLARLLAWWRVLRGS